MKAIRLWQGIRMRQVAAGADPDVPPRLITLPADWDDHAAAALAALVPGHGPASLAAAAAVWLGLAASQARRAGAGEAGADALAAGLHRLLVRRQAAPNAATWAGSAGVPGFRINAAGFHDAAAGFDVAGFACAAALVARATRLLAPDAPLLEIGLAGLDDLLACLGIAYDSRAARAVGAALAALLRGHVSQALQGDQPDLLATAAPWPAPPSSCAIPGLAESATAARDACRHTPGAVPATGVFAPGPTEALLGIETGGIAPAFAPVRDRRLTRAAAARLAAAAMSPEAALAAVLAGETPLPGAGLAAHAAMHQAMAPFLEAMPAEAAALPAPPGAASGRSGRQPLPARPAGLARKVSIGGHRVFLRTAEYPDGRLGEIVLSLPRESAAVRGLAECFAQAVSLGLQHGIPLAEFVDAFAASQFGPAGAVEGDPDVARAASVLDYVFRSLSASYLGRVLPEPEPDPTEDAVDGRAPLLPLELPTGPGVRRRGLRLVA